MQIQVLIRSFTLLILLAVASYPAYAANPCELPTMSQEGGIGGTGNTDDSSGDKSIDNHPEGGIGGTGQKVSSGIGGTGQKLTLTEGKKQKIAVIGVITGFASICVNGIEVHYENNTEVSINGSAASSADLAVGQVVTLSAENSSKGWVASRIMTHDAVSGPVSKATSPGTVEILGQTVRIPQGLTNRVNAGIGQHLRVQGIRAANGEILATNILPRTADGAAVVTGPIRRLPDGSAAVGNLKVTNVPKNLVDTNQQLNITGRMAGGNLRATTVHQALQPDPQADILSIQSSVTGTENGQLQMQNGLLIKASTTNLPKGIVHIFAQKDVNGDWQALKLDNKSHEDLLRRAGERENNSGKKRGESSSSSSDNEESDNSRSGSNSGSSNSDRNSENGDDSNNDSNESGSNSGSRHSGSSEKAVNESQPDRLDKLEKVEKPDKVDKVEKVERVDKVEKIERIDKVEKVERIDKIEKVEKIERVEKIDTPKSEDRSVGSNRSGIDSRTRDADRQSGRKGHH